MKVLCVSLLFLFINGASSELFLQTRLSSLDPLSVGEHLAFYELYPQTSEGKAALKHAWRLLSRETIAPEEISLELPKVDIHPMIFLLTRQTLQKPEKLSQEQLNVIEQLSESLANRSLKGHHVWSREELRALPSQEIDLSRGLLIEQFDENKEEIAQYEATLDLMALQILARLSRTPSPEDSIREINRFIFQEMEFRFPPHSLHAKEIDLYTFLPSVMDHREGVCLGVSILYLSLAQRLGLPLEIVTPPGHIYLRYRQGIKVVNIETTSRGIHLPSEIYLGVDTRWVPQRNIREVIALNFFNQASVCWSQKDYQQAVKCYEKAAFYMPKDPLLNFFLGLNYLFIDKKKEAHELLSPLRGYTFEWNISQETIPDDYFQNQVDVEGIQAIFLPIDEKRDSILQKQTILQGVAQKYPLFRAGLLQLAVTWLQLGRYLEAEEILERYHQIDPNHSVVEYYLSIISIQKLDYRKAWYHMKNTEKLLKARDHCCKALSDLKNQLLQSSPDESLEWSDEMGKEVVWTNR